jgi:hypothetical protein
LRKRSSHAPAQRHAAALAPGQGRHVAVAVRKTERVHGPVDRGIEAPDVVPVDQLLHLPLLDEQRVEVRVWLCECGRDLAEPVEQVAVRPHAVLHIRAHILGFVQLGLLLQEADGGAGRELGDSGGRLLEPRHDPQDRGLAGAVRAEYPNLRPGQERQRDAGKHLPFRTVELVGPIHRVHVLAHRPAKLAAWRRRPWSC